MDINKANIANALHSVAKEHIVATADEIYDNDREQYQSEVNETVGRYVENPEFVCVYTDAENRILWGIKADADIFYGAGVPTQLREYVEKKIEELSLDEYEDIVAFLDGFIGSDTTLQAILESLNITIEKKVDKEEGKSLIDSEYASTKSNIKNPEFLEVTTDSEDKVLEGIQQDGTKVIGGDLNIGGSANINGDATVRGNVELTSESIQSIDNPEYLKVTTDVHGKILDGIKKDGSHYIHNVQSETIDALNTRVDNTNTHVDEVDNKLHTLRKVSILGDSISTFDQDGFKINGFGMWYPKEGDRSSDVKSVEDTWWKQVINNQGGIIEVNASYSGSTASNLCIGFSPRVPLLGNPDIIYIALGTNDSGFAVPVGEIDFNAASYDLSKFAPAYIKGMQDTVAAYPKAKIICVAFDMGAAYQAAIKTIAEHYGAEYIYVGDISDVHPNKSEMKAVAEEISPVIPMSIHSNPKYISVVTDSEDRVLEGTKADGTKVINTDLELNARFNQQGVITEIVDSPEYLEAKVDAEGKLIEGINKNGEKIFGVIPPQIKQYIDENIPAGGSGVSSIEYDENTGDMYATYEDESGVTDVYMEPNGDIYVESEE